MRWSRRSGSRPNSKEVARKKRKSRSRWSRRLFIALGAIVASYLIWEVVTWPDVAALKSKRPETTAFIERYKRKSGKTRVAQVWVPYDQISLELKHAVLAGEDLG